MDISQVKTMFPGLIIFPKNSINFPLNPFKFHQFPYHFCLFLHSYHEFPPKPPITVGRGWLRRLWRRPGPGGSRRGRGSGGSGGGAAGAKSPGLGVEPSGLRAEAAADGSQGWMDGKCMEMWLKYLRWWVIHNQMGSEIYDLIWQNRSWVLGSWCGVYA